MSKITPPPAMTDKCITECAIAAHEAHKEYHATAWAKTFAANLLEANNKQWLDMLAQQEPFGYFHELIQNKGGVWLGVTGENAESICRQAHTDGETGEAVIPLYAAPVAQQAGVAKVAACVRSPSGEYRISATSDRPIPVGAALHLHAAPIAQQAVHDGCKVVPVEALKRWRAAFAEELAAYDIDPPIHHVKASHDEIDAMLDAAPEAPAPQPLTEPTEYTGVRCMCVLTGCQAGPGCPHYTEHCRKHIDHERAHGITKGDAS